MGFLDRINFSFEAYYKRTSNMLMRVPESYTVTGEGYRWKNVGVMANKGIELSADGDVIRTRDFTWNVSANGTPSGVVARLLQKKRHFYNKDKYYGLQLGSNTIGMYDSSSPSDIMIEGDRTISHRSVTILVEAVGHSYKYLLTVNRSKNPVYLSGKMIPVGTSVYIQLDQEFILGKTHFCPTNK